MNKNTNMVNATMLNPDGVPYGTLVHKDNVVTYRGTAIYARNHQEVIALLDLVDNSFGDIGTEAQRVNAARAFDDIFFNGEENELLSEATHEDGVPLKKKRVSAPKSPLFELLPQVFKGNGKVRKHPFNNKAKTSEVREIIRNAAKISMKNSVIIVLPVGTLQLSSDFKNLCVNSVGTSTFDLVIEEMMMMGWTIRGINLNTDNSIDLA